MHFSSPLTMWAWLTTMQASVIKFVGSLAHDMLPELSGLSRHLCQYLLISSPVSFTVFIDSILKTHFFTCFRSRLPLEPQC